MGFGVTCLPFAQAGCLAVQLSLPDSSLVEVSPMECLWAVSALDSVICLARWRVWQ